eukprot:TCALIF_08354-PA protein Name:"Similar to Sh3beta SH3 domain-binding glutamic acid-rich protein homolog (Drosophila melanogaster)" AED:0.15 eAED:0.15 QI:0/0.8/0.83/0.83/0.6/0.5/6/357/213
MIVTHQQRIFMILKSLGIEFEPVDITAPGREKDRDYMREQGKKKEGQRHVLPPQLFNDDVYCGDYDDFDVANEDDELEEFLKIERRTPKSTPSHLMSSATNPPPQQAPSESTTDETGPQAPNSETDRPDNDQDGAEPEVAGEPMETDGPESSEATEALTEATVAPVDAPVESDESADPPAEVKDGGEAEVEGKETKEDEHEEEGEYEEYEDEE